MLSSILEAHPMKAASLYLRRGKVFVESNSRTTSGFWIVTGPVRVFDEADIAGVGEALRMALENSRRGVETPGPGEDLTGPMRAAADVKTWSAFVKEARSVDATLTDGVVTLTPYRRVDRIGNYVPISEKARTVRLLSDELGREIAESFRDAS
jgi:hypothetical protein